MSFTESNTVEQMILDAATSLGTGACASISRLRMCFHKMGAIQ